MTATVLTRVTLTVRGVDGMIGVERVVGLLRQRGYGVSRLEARFDPEGSSASWTLDLEVDPDTRLELLLDRMNRLTSVVEVDVP